jgi:hypothetical protein
MKDIQHLYLFNQQINILNIERGKTNRMFGPAIKVINAIRSIKMVPVELIRGHIAASSPWRNN